MKRPPNILHLLLTALTTAEALKISNMRPSVKTQRNEDIILPCDISGLNTANPISILWTRKSENGTVDDVCEYDDKGVTVFRPGCKMEVAEILKGNAELHIPEVQFTDEGEYTCKVINTPDSDSGTTTLQVSVPPSADVTPAIPTIELGTEKTMACNVYNFYPKDISIRWAQYRKGSSDCQLLEIWMCVKKLLENPDGTFNVTSLLTLKPNKEDDGSIYTCIITHRSLLTDLSRNFTLTVTEKEDSSKAVITAVVVTLLMVALLGLFVLLYFRFIKKDPPTLSEITGNDKLTDMNKATLTCQIMNFRPKAIGISVCMRRSGEEKMRIIYTWRSGGPGSVVTMSSDDNDVELGRPLMNGSAGHEDRPLKLEVDCRITVTKLGGSSCQCSLHITPSYELDNGAELSVQVTHPALTSAASVSRTLHVIGVPPKLSSIMAPERVLHEEKLTLICPINAFKPRALSITWLKKDRDHQETQLVTWTPEDSTTHNEKYSHNLKEDEYDDKSYSFLSALSMKPTVAEDDGVTYICRVFHPATNHREEKERTIRVIALPVLDSILKAQDFAYVGEKLDLSCRIHAFYPRHIQVTWYTEDNVIMSSRTTEPLQENDRLCHVTSTSTYTPTMADLGKTFRCEVQHDSLLRPKCGFLTLSPIVSSPSLGDILCDPKFPEPGVPVTLSYEIKDMYPGDVSIQWYQGITKLKPEEWQTNIQQNTESKIFSGTTELKLTPTRDAHGDLMRLDIAHCGKVFTKELLLHLKGLPVLSEITTDPLIADYGKPLTLRCDVTGCNDDDITQITWSGRGKESRARTGEVLSCYLTISPTAEDYGKLYTCTVTHRNTGKRVVKKKHLHLPERTPTLSDIIVRPARLTANQEASFQVTISGYSPRDLLIKWYKAFNTFPQSHVTISEPEIGSDHLYKSSSTLTFTPMTGDDETEVRCEVTHSKNVRQKRCILNLTDGSDKTKAALKPGPKKMLSIREIRCVPERPRMGQEVTLIAYIEACEVHGGEITWYNGMFTIDEEMVNKKVGNDCTSSVTFTPDPKTGPAIKLEVFYNYQTAEKDYTLPLE